jgi:uncharacterized protein
MSALRIDVADLLTHPGARRPVHLEAALDDLGTPVARIVEPVRLDLVLERVPDGIVARGELHARWDGECTTCLRELAADLTVGVAELYETHPLDGDDTYPIEGHEIDLEQLVRDALVLELPLAPTCERDDCAPAEAEGVLVGADDRPTEDSPTDPRWAALSQLDLSDSK